MQKRACDLNPGEMIVHGKNEYKVISVSVYGGHAAILIDRPGLGQFQSIGPANGMREVRPRCPHVEGDGPCATCDNPEHRVAMGWDVLDGLD